MSYLRNIKQKNRQKFEKVKEYLIKNNLDLNNLPPIQKIKIQIENVPSRPIPSSQPIDKDENDSEDQFIIEYLQNKNKNNRDQGQGSHQGRSQYKDYSSSLQVNYRKREEEMEDPVRMYKSLEEQDSKQGNSNFFQEFQYKSYGSEDHSNPTYSLHNKEKDMNKSKKPNKNTLKKDLFQSKLQELSLDEYKNKYKIEDALKSLENVNIKPNYIPANIIQWQNHNKNQDYKLYNQLKKFINIKQFKNNQKAIIKCCLEDHNVFVCMPTGGGKSLTYQILTFLVKGVYLCVLPLVSLIFDQEYQAKMFGIQAYSLTANTEQSEVRSIYSKLSNFQTSDKSIVIFCTPQKLNLSQIFSDILETLYKKDQLKRIIIDEVHCVSTWGKEFRIQYENLSSIKKRFKKTPILGLTATVTQIIKQDIIKRLGIEYCYFFQSSFNRVNLYYEVRNKDKNILKQITQILNKYANRSGIIYCLSRKECEEMSEKLNKQGHKTAFYHSDINQQQKKHIQESWMKNKIYIIVATIAFGMGINKPDVRFVIHHTLSKSLENYYQESGRAGRDGEISDCILFYRKSDKNFLMSMTLKNDFSSKECKEFSTKQLAQMIKYCEDKQTCRREFQLQYLGEYFNPEDCHKTCDNCRRNLPIKIYEGITHAKYLIKTLLKMQEHKVTISKTQIISLIMKKKMPDHFQYKLSSLKRSGYQIQDLQRQFEGWRVEELQALLLEFMSSDIINEQIIQSKVDNKNYNNAYLKCNVTKCRLFLDKVETMPIRRVLMKGEGQGKGNSSGEEGGYDYLFQEEGDDEGSSHQGGKGSHVIVQEETAEQKFKKYQFMLESIFQEQEL